MKFKDFKKLINILIDLKIEIENIRKSEYERLTTREKMYFNISQTLNNIHKAEDLEATYFSESANEEIKKRENEIAKMVEYLDQNFENWQRLFWINLDRLEKYLNSYLKNIDPNLSVSIQAEKNTDKNLITNAVSNRKYLTILVNNEKDGTSKEFIFDLKEIGYDYKEIKKLVKRSTKRLQDLSNEVLISPDMFVTKPAQRLEDRFPGIRDEFWKAIADGMGIVRLRNGNLLEATIEKNNLAIAEKRVLIARQERQNKDCEATLEEIKNNPEISVDPTDL